MADTRGAVRRQVEYYFSLENLVKDTYLRSRLDAQGWLDVDTINQFNRIRSLTGGDAYAPPRYGYHPDL